MPAPSLPTPAAATACDPAPHATATLTERDRFEAAFMFWHARYADDPPGALAALGALARQAARDRQQQLAARYDALHCALRRGSRWYPGMLPDRLLPLHHAAVTTHRLRHDAAQFQYLHELGVLGDEFPPIIARYRRLAARLAAGQPPHRELISSAEQEALDDAYDRIVHLRPTPCVARPLSDHARHHARQVVRQPDCIVVIDDFLSAEALAALWRFCLQSTVWLNEEGHGRLGASYENGFNCPLLVQVAHGLLGDRHPLAHVRGCKHPPCLPGEALQADRADIKLNLWLTPDDANLDQSGGGLFIRAPDGGTRYIAYRQNRAVLFPSRLLHGAAARSFRDDYASRRLDVMLLYATSRYSTPSARIAAISSSP